MRNILNILIAKNVWPQVEYVTVDMWLVLASQLANNIVSNLGRITDLPRLVENDSDKKVKIFAVEIADYT